MERIFNKPATMAVAITFMSLAILTTSAEATGPDKINYQGSLRDAGGPFNGTVNMTFKIYSVAVGGTALWTETHTGVVVTDGVFNVALGAGTPPTPIDETTFDGTERWLEVTVGSDPALVPRHQFMSSPYAMRATVADVALSGGNAGGWTIVGSNMYSSVPGNVGVGTDTPADKLNVLGNLRIEQNDPGRRGWRFRPTQDGIGNTNRLYIEDTTYIGSNNGIRLSENNTGFRMGIYAAGTTGTYPFAIYDGEFDEVATQTFRVETGGNVIISMGEVGIGTTAPAEKLDVLGGIQATRGDAGRSMSTINTSTGSVPQTANIERVEAVPSANDLLQLAIATGSSNTCQFIEAQRGAAIEWALNGDGTVTTAASFNGGGADFAEMLELVGGHRSAAPGDVMVIDPTRENAVVRSTGAYSTLVVGVYSIKPGFIGSTRSWMMESAGADESSVLTTEDMKERFDLVPVGMVGVVPTKVSAENGPIRPGDLLVSSNTPGHGMKASESPKAGSVIGKALESLPAGTGTINVYVTVR